MKITSDILYAGYLKIREQLPEAPEIEILILMVAMRGPFWSGDLENITFKNYPAFVIRDNMSVGALINFINIWELIIIEPKEVSSQSITEKELKDMIDDNVTISYSVFNLEINTSSEKAISKIKEKYFEYTKNAIIELGGVINN